MNGPASRWKGKPGDRSSRIGPIHDDRHRHRPEMRKLRNRLEQAEAGRRQAEKDLKEKQDRFQAFLDNGRCASLSRSQTAATCMSIGPSESVFNGDRATLTANRTAIVILKRWFAGYTAPRRGMVLRTGRVLETVEEVPTPDGVLRSWLVFKFPVPDAAGRQLLGDGGDQHHRPAAGRRSSPRKRSVSRGDLGVDLRLCLPLLPWMPAGRPESNRRPRALPGSPAAHPGGTAGAGDAGQPDPPGRPAAPRHQAYRHPGGESGFEQGASSPVPARSAGFAIPTLPIWDAQVGRVARSSARSRTLPTNGPKQLPKRIFPATSSGATGPACWKMPSRNAATWLANSTMKSARH